MKIVTGTLSVVIISTAAFFLIPSTVFCNEELTKVHGQKFKIFTHFGLSQTESASFISFRGESPGFLSRNRLILESPSEIGSYLEFDAISSSVIDSEDSSRHALSFRLGGGLVARSVISDQLAFSATAGFYLLKMSKLYTDRNTGAGCKIGYGPELIFGPKYTASFQFSYYYHNATAEKMYGNPHLFDGIGLSLGMGGWI